MNNTPYQKISIDSWKGLTKFYEKNQAVANGWVFKGAERSTWRLTTTLERLLRERFNRPLAEAWRYERLLLRQFVRSADRFLTTRPESPMEWLAVMRHHGGPARLSDWTYSFWIALYFAVEKAHHNSKCVIWALDIERWIDSVKTKIPELRCILDKGSNTPEEFDFILNCKNKAGIWPVNPFKLNERLYVQQGVFILPLDITRPFMKNLQAVAPSKTSSAHFYKIVISLNHKFLCQCLSELQRKNINTETLYPGLDGFTNNFANFPGMRHMSKGLSDEMLDKPLRELICPLY